MKKLFSFLGILFLGFASTHALAERNPCLYDNDVNVIGPVNGKPLVEFSFYEEEPDEFKGPVGYKFVLICERENDGGTYVITTEHLFPHMVVRNPPQEILAITSRPEDYFVRIYLNSAILNHSEPYSREILVVGRNSLKNLHVFEAKPYILAGMPMLKARLDHVRAFDEERKIDFTELSVIENSFETPSY